MARPAPVHKDRPIFGLEGEVIQPMLVPANLVRAAGTVQPASAADDAITLYQACARDCRWCHRKGTVACACGYGRVVGDGANGPTTNISRAHPHGRCWGSGDGAVVQVRDHQAVKTVVDTAAVATTFLFFFCATARSLHAQTLFILRFSLAEWLPSR